MRPLRCGLGFWRNIALEVKEWGYERGLKPDLLGPQRSGILASFPVILTVIGVFTLRQWGRDALLRMLRGVTQSLLAFVGFFAVVGFGTPVWGQNIAFAGAALVAIAISGALIAINGRIAKRTLQRA